MRTPRSPADEAHSGSAAERSLRLLSTLAHEGRPLSLADLVQALGLPKATVHRQLTQLLEAGFVVRDTDEREFGVGPALRQLALDTLNHGSLRGLRHEVLADLVAEVGETCNFTTTDGAGVLYLDRVEAPWPWRLTLEVGAHVPLHCTASGKLFLAFMPEPRREQLMAHLTLKRMTASTLTTVEALRAECEAIVDAGHSYDREEFIDGLLAVAVPVRDAQGEVRAALAVHAPTGRLSLETAGQRIPALHAAALRMGRLL
ncbi:MAG: IclR family transcriptional regulator [Rubrivivax sp.]|nr:IclR family transcriptional regulator [Rubrivivax sp.]